jgi:hypothetical protein
MSCSESFALVNYDHIPEAFHRQWFQTSFPCDHSKYTPGLWSRPKYQSKERGSANDEFWMLIHEIGAIRINIIKRLYHKSQTIFTHISIPMEISSGVSRWTLIETSPISSLSICDDSWQTASQRTTLHGATRGMFGWSLCHISDNSCWMRIHWSLSFSFWFSFWWIFLAESSPLTWSLFTRC